MNSLRLECLVWIGVLLTACCASAVAQSVIGGAPLGTGFQTPQLPQARPYGADGKELPGKRVAAAGDIQRKWHYQETRNNVVVDGVRVPLRVAKLALQLNKDGTYTLDYEVYWGAGRNDPRAQQAGLVAKEQGRYSVSGSILLLEADPFEVIEQGRFERKQRAVPAEKRAYIARLESGQLNVAGPCASYQVEAVCERSRTVWFPLASETLQGLRGPTAGTPATMRPPGR
jgi:hypothetical protein